MLQQPVQSFNLGLGAISCHAWNKDRTQIAVSPRNNEVHIFSWKNGRWEKTCILDEHDFPITGIDWAPNTNRIVTSSQDKNAFVWTFDGQNWKPELVILRLQKAATCVKWSPQENKFAVGSGSKLVSVCYYEKENDWWLPKQIKKPIRSTVTSLDWHPNNVLLAVGSCDFKTRIFSGYVKEVDNDKIPPSPWAIKIPSFGQMLCEFSNGGGGWVHGVSFSPSGTRLAWVGHDSSLSIADSCTTEDDFIPQTNGTLTNGASSATVASSPSAATAGSFGSKNVTTLKEWYLPFTSVLWVSENSIVAAGYDCCPMLFAYKQRGDLKFISKLDVPAEQRSNKITAMDRFRHLDRISSADFDTSLKTLHQNAITTLRSHTSQSGKISKFSTVGVDGQMIVWDLKKLEASVDSIKVE